MLFTTAEGAKAKKVPPELTPECGFLDEALALAREAVVLRERLNTVQHQYNTLLGQREEAAREGRDVTAQIRPLFLEIEELPGKIAQLEERARWIVEHGVATLNAQNAQRAAEEYFRVRDDLRQEVERFRDTWAVIQERMNSTASLAAALTIPHNEKLEEIQGVLGGGPLPRVLYTALPVPSINTDKLNRDGMWAALDIWIGALR